MNDNTLALMPALSLEDAKDRYHQMGQFVNSIMKEGIDYGLIPGTGDKKTLLKPGAEKLTTLFGLRNTFVDEGSIEDWEAPFFFYRRKCQLWRGDMLIAEASGSCNSREDRYGYRWVPLHEVPADLDKSKLSARVSRIGEWGWVYEKRETSGKYGKPEEYWKKFDEALDKGTVIKSNKVQPWNNKEDVYFEIETVMYRVPNENIYSLVNTLIKMAEKRAYIAATLLAVNASDYFTQDMEDLVDGVRVEKEEDVPDGEVIEGEFKEDDNIIERAIKLLETPEKIGEKQFWYLATRFEFKTNACTAIKERNKNEDGTTNWPASFGELIEQAQKIEKAEEKTE